MTPTKKATTKKKKQTWTEQILTQTKQLYDKQRSLTTKQKELLQKIDEIQLRDLKTRLEKGYNIRIINQELYQTLQKTKYITKIPTQPNYITIQNKVYRISALIEGDCLYIERNYITYGKRESVKREILEGVELKDIHFTLYRPQTLLIQTRVKLEQLEQLEKDIKEIREQTGIETSGESLTRTIEEVELIKTFIPLNQEAKETNKQEITEEETIERREIERIQTHYTIKPFKQNITITKEPTQTGKYTIVITKNMTTKEVIDIIVTKEINIQELDYIHSNTHLCPYIKINDEEDIKEEGNITILTGRKICYGNWAEIINKLGKHNYFTPLIIAKTIELIKQEDYIGHGFTKWQKILTPKKKCTQCQQIDNKCTCQECPTCTRKTKRILECKHCTECCTHQENTTTLPTINTQEEQQTIDMNEDQETMTPEQAIEMTLRPRRDQLNNNSDIPNEINDLLDQINNEGG